MGWGWSCISEIWYVPTNGNTFFREQSSFYRLCWVIVRKWLLTYRVANWRILLFYKKNVELLQKFQKVQHSRSYNNAFLGHSLHRRQKQPQKVRRFRILRRKQQFFKQLLRQVSSFLRIKISTDISIILIKLESHTSQSQTHNSRIQSSTSGTPHKLLYIGCIRQWAHQISMETIKRTFVPRSCAAIVAWTPETYEHTQTTDGRSRWHNHSNQPVPSH